MKFSAVLHSLRCLMQQVFYAEIIWGFFWAI